ncbi:ABC-three component system protein [Phyllobacterium sophorae]|uniref:Alpha/beta hydrolase n=1 Tax=Phyllobacterium sophorae TaxID=1520277 RepID=A0A2P7B6H6_9HYPH|nr:ABC-three component system protein [Phyllobacterium sophorae]PSH62077.1 alpha/beta hydrolase [Phyllobacterium sophorae]
MVTVSSPNYFATISANGGTVDVIFVHGLSGDPVETWTADGSKESEGGYWPQWLAADVPHLNLYTLGFPASVFAQWAKKEMNLYDRAKNFLETLASYEFGKRPIIFICHSLGGLLVKQILRTAKESTDEDWRRVGERCVGIFFLATPHSGSSVANLLKFFVQGFTSVHVNKLLNDNAELQELNESFRSHCHAKPITVLVYHEQHLTRKTLLVVDAKSADPGVTGTTPVPIDADHIGICKPRDRNSLIYTSIRHRIRKLAPVIPPDEPTGLEKFADDGLEDTSPTDRRDLMSKMVAAGRDHEYPFANDSQSKFARPFVRTGLKTSISTVYKNLLADIEQRFQTLVFHPLICNGADELTISKAIQSEIVEPLSAKYAADRATAKTIMNALYFLTERCHIRWDRP